MKTTDKYVFFWRGIFSNWYTSPIKMSHPVTRQEIIFANSEQLFMWLKARFFGDEETAAKIAAEPDPKKAKALGREVKNFNEVRWSHFATTYMFIACLAKFSQNFELAQELVATGQRVMVEASPVDKIWGVGLGEDDPAIENENNWQGKNLLGQTLNAVRDCLIIAK